MGWPVQVWSSQLGSRGARSVLLFLSIAPEVDFSLARRLEYLLGVIVAVLPSVTVRDEEACVKVSIEDGVFYYKALTA